MIVVSNTSPITNLAAIGQLELLHKLFGRIVTPGAVVSELNAGGVLWPGATELTRARWIRVENVTDRFLVDALRLELDHGEAETIVLALQRKAGLVLLDEQAGREAAKYMGLQPCASGTFAGAAMLWTTPPSTTCPSRRRWSASTARTRTSGT